MHVKSKKSSTSRENTMTVYPLLNKTFEVEIYDSINDAADRWTLLAPSGNAFLQVPYFRFLEAHPPKGLALKYLLFTKKEQIVGLAICQLVQLRVGEALKDKDLPAYQKKVNSWILKMANMNAIISGNLLLTGDHGTHFLPEIQEETKYLLVEAGMERLKSYLKKQDHSTSLLIVKDIPHTKKKHLQSSIGKNFNEFALQPNMVLSIREEWASFEDYLQAMTSKSRVRAKRAFKKGQDIVKKEFTVELMKAFLPQIDKLYKCIADKAGFNVIHLDGNYFLSFKECFPERFRVFGYFIADELIAFYTTFHNYSELEAHFLGFDTTNNLTYQAYLNILFDIVRIGIDSKVEQINFARTALEIKSSVGATPEELYFYGKHTNPIKNQIFSPVLAYFQPKYDWKPRNPFKAKSPE